MSTYWDVRCLDCNEESGLHLNHGDDTCRELIKIRDGLAGLTEFDHWGGLTVAVSGERGYVDTSFYKKHAGHVLAPVSEYGDIDGDCNETRPTGPHTTDGARCRKPTGHQEPDHDFVLASLWDPAWEAVRKAAAERRRG